MRPFLMSHYGLATMAAGAILNLTRGSVVAWQEVVTSL